MAAYFGLFGGAPGVHHRQPLNRCDPTHSPRALPPSPSPPQDVIDRDLGVTFDAIASLGEAKRLLNEVREGRRARVLLINVLLILYY